MIKALFLAAGTSIALCASPLAAQGTADPGQSSAPEQEPQRQEARLALAQEILDIGFPEDTQLEMFQAVTDQMEAQMLQSLQGMITDEGALAILVAWQERTSVQTDALLRKSVPSLMEAWAIAYADTYDEQELKDIRDFVSTPSGEAFMRRSNDVIFHPAFAAANQEYMNETMALVVEHVPELEREIRAYMEAKDGAE